MERRDEHFRHHARIPDDEDVSIEQPPSVAVIPVAAASNGPPKIGNNQAEHNDQRDSESQAASDVAVEAKPKSQRNRDRADAAVSRSDRAAILTYPNPRNFAERLMGAMQGNLAPDCLIWAGEGTVVAMHPKNLRKGGIMTNHFKVANFGAFIRNFTRWGFRRVTHIPVPDGMTVYQNSLFRRDEPGLVKQMRIDSDVQDVFERQQGPSDVPESIEFADADRPGSENETGSIDLAPHQQQLVDWLNGTGWSAQGAAPPPPQAQMQQPPPQPAPPAPAPSHASLVSRVATLLLQALQPPPAPEPTTNFSVRDSLYTQILDLSQQYMNQATATSSGDKSIILILQLLNVFDERPRRTTPSTASQPTRPQATASQQSQVAQTPSPNDASGVALQTIQMIMQSNGGQVQQAPPPTPPPPPQQQQQQQPQLLNLLQMLVQPSQPQLSAAGLAGAQPIPAPAVPQQQPPQQNNAVQQQRMAGLQDMNNFLRMLGQPQKNAGGQD